MCLTGWMVKTHRSVWGGGAAPPGAAPWGKEPGSPPPGSPRSPPGSRGRSGPCIYSSSPGPPCRPRQETGLSGHRTQVTGHRLQHTGHRSHVTGHMSQVTCHRSHVTLRSVLLPKLKFYKQTRETDHNQS